MATVKIIFKREKEGWQGCGETGRSVTTGGIVNWYYHYKKHYGGFSKLSIELYDPAFPIPVI